MSSETLDPAKYRPNRPVLVWHAPCLNAIPLMDLVSYNSQTIFTRACFNSLGLYIVALMLDLIVELVEKFFRSSSPNRSTIFSRILIYCWSLITRA